MGEIQFEDSTQEFGPPATQKPGSDLTGKIIAWGLAKDRQQAEYVLIGLAIGAIVVAYILYKMMSGGGSDTPPLLPQ